jgi:excisionase family DNA binding protein
MDGFFFAQTTMKPDEQPERPALFSIERSAAYLSVSERTIRNLIANGELVGRHIGRRTLVPFTSLQNFLKRDHATQKITKEK